MLINKRSFFLHTKEHIIIALRLMVFACLAIISYQGLKNASYPIYIALIVFLINTFLIQTRYFRLLESFGTLALGFIIDIMTMTILLYYSSGYDRFYLVFLITILISATVHNLRGAFITSIAISVIYGLISLQEQIAAKEILLSFPFLIRVVFLFITAIFIGYLSEEAEQERQEKEIIQSELFKKQRLAVTGQLASGLAHDFFNILGGLKKLIDFSLKEDPPSEQHKVMKMTAHGLDRAMTIVRNLLTYAKKPVPQPVATNVNKIMEEVISLVQHDFKKDNIAIIESIGEIPDIKVDPSQLHQVFLNILLNARQAMLPQGGKLSISIKPTGKFLEIKISDTGSGIDPEIKPMIFEPFFSDSTAISKKITGIGLGLYVSHEIITAHKGLISIDSEKGKGSEVSIKLPLET